MRTYTINGKEIAEVTEELYVSGNFLAGKINQILEALNEKKEECEHKWAEYKNTPSGYACRKCYIMKEESKSTLRYYIADIIKKENQHGYGLDIDDFYSETDKIIALFKDTLLKEIDQQQFNSISDLKTITNLINNL